MKIYVAGPLGFTDVGRLFHEERLLPLLRSLGHDIIDPWKLTPQTLIDPVLALPYGPAKRAAWQTLNRTIGRNNRDGIAAADAILAVLDGVDVDSGTASEIGFAYALGKAILGYRGDFRLSADNEGALVNLQVEFFIRDSGGDIVTALDAISDALDRLKRWRNEGFRTPLDDSC